MIWVLWFFLLVAQNAAFTLVSRARNSESLAYHAWTSLLSNGVWFVSQLILVDFVVKILRSGSVQEFAFAAVVYVAGTMTGAITMHWVALHKIEKTRGGGH